MRFSYTKSLGGGPRDPANAAETARIADATQAGPDTTLSVNFAASVYEHIPENLKVGRFRDVQFAAQLDRTLGPRAWERRPVLSFATYHQYMATNQILEFKTDLFAPNTNIPLPRPAVEVLDTKGYIGLLQSKLTIPLGKTGVDLPLAFSWANRTELIPRNTRFGVFRGQIGLTFDLARFLGR